MPVISGLTVLPYWLQFVVHIGTCRKVIQISAQFISTLASHFTLLKLVMARHHGLAPHQLVSANRPAVLSSKVLDPGAGFVLSAPCIVLAVDIVFGDKRMFNKILIANRGEIAVRVIRTCREMGIKAVAVYSDADVDSLHVKLADEAHLIVSPDPFRAYLDMERILEIAERTGCEAIHPGYGFLAENPDFVGMCADRGIVFVGPPNWCMYKAKPKNKARQLMKMINLPVIPGSDEAIEGSSAGALNRALEIAAAIGYPVIVKPSSTGGGIGMMVARNAEQLKTAAKYAEERGRSAFGVAGYYIEKFLSGVKHVEFQVLADSKGNAVFLGERDCSIQRRFQKLVEEAPCPVLTPLLRMKMGVAAIDVAKAMRYVNAMTVEFLYVSETREFYFNEVNARLQVEHCINELITGIDIVREQIKIAAGEEISFSQDDI